MVRRRPITDKDLQRGLPRHADLGRALWRACGSAIVRGLASLFLLLLFIAATMLLGIWKGAP